MEVVVDVAASPAGIGRGIRSAGDRLIVMARAFLRRELGAGSEP